MNLSERVATGIQKGLESLVPPIQVGRWCPECKGTRLVVKPKKIQNLTVMGLDHCSMCGGTGLPIPVQENQNELG